MESTCAGACRAARRLAAQMTRWERSPGRALTFSGPVDDAWARPWPASRLTSMGCTLAHGQGGRVGTELPPAPRPRALPRGAMMNPLASEGTRCHQRAFGDRGHPRSPRPARSPRAAGLEELSSRSALERGARGGNSSRQWPCQLLSSRLVSLRLGAMSDHAHSACATTGCTVRATSTPRPVLTTCAESGLRFSYPPRWQPAADKDRWRLPITAASDREARYLSR